MEKLCPWLVRWCAFRIPAVSVQAVEQCALLSGDTFKYD